MSDKRLSETPAEVCEGCHADYLYLTKATEWFTIFFIPIIPYKSKHYLMCPNCKRGYEIKEDVEIDKILEELNDSKRGVSE